MSNFFCFGKNALCTDIECIGCKHYNGDGGEYKTTGLKTLDMMNTAQKDNCTYISGDMTYNTKLGFHEAYTTDFWEGRAFNFINDIMELEWNKMED